ncbi:predicted protein [Histoplasma capsulatum G186AR]|uniref:Uncharacterized protein n=1 Tax=Ajellomyces capsulatus (strain G186AR / H82 / ATCC MYA-2454 / RMSCC 2432) TaxID=447093 RepID=C0NVH5_AJECG|nr:uncharacterized protein HCBG_07155 [Histoplasma capsulatum G186AR]EEH04514.1 predicted protein [Histoplasma capsulatum G186AR]
MRRDMFEFTLQNRHGNLFSAIVMDAAEMSHMDKDRGTNGPGPSPGDFPIGQLARIVRSGSRVNTRSSVWRFQKSEPRMYNQPRREGQTDTCETSIELKNLASRQTSN